MNYKYTLGLIDKWTGPVKSIQSSMGGFGAMADKSRQQIKGLKTSLGDISKFESMKTKSVELSAALGKQRDSVAALKKQLEAAENPSAALVRRFSAQSSKLGELEDKYSRYRGQMGGVVKSLKAQGVNTRKLGLEQQRLENNLDGSTSKLRKQQKVMQGWNATAKGLTDLKSKFGGFAKWTAGIATGGAVAGAGIIGKFASTAGDFEDKFAVLKTLEQGDGSKAQKSFDWVKTFAKTTPYQLGQVTDSFVKLRAYGIDPIKGDTLRILGDTAAGMGKDVMDAVESIADAVNGENERLKEFGIKASKIKGSKGKPAMIEYSFTNKDGKQELQRVQADNTAAIQSTLMSIWNSKYKGAMDERSKTWNGLLSNMGDTWTNFQSSVMQAGALDFLKGKLKTGLEWVSLKETTGELQEWAQIASDGFVTFTEKAWAAGETIYTVGKDFMATANSVAEFVGGWDKLLMGVAAFAVVGSVLGTVGAIASGVAALAGAFTLLAVPIGVISAPILLIGGAVAGAVAAGWYLYNNWDEVVTRIKNWTWTDLFNITSVIPGIGAVVAAGKYLYDNWNNFTLLGDWSFLPNVTVEEGFDWAAWRASWIPEWAKDFTLLGDWSFLPSVSTEDWEWPSLPDWTWPDIGSFSLSGWFSDWEWPNLPDWAWPDIGEFSLKSLISDWEWPTLPELPDLLGSFGDIKEKLAPIASIIKLLAKLKIPGLSKLSGIAGSFSNLFGKSDGPNVSKLERALELSKQLGLDPQKWAFEKLGIDSEFLEPLKQAQSLAANLGIDIPDLPFKKMLSGVMPLFSKIGAGLALISLPVTGVVVALVAVGAAAWALYKNWDEVVAYTTTKWSELSAWWDSWSWSDLIPEFSLSNWFSDWTWPTLPVWTWPVVAGFSLLDYFFDFDWPTLPDWEWPSIPEFKLPDMPEVSGWFSGLFGDSAAPDVAKPEMTGFKLPELPVPAPIQFALDLSPINLAIGRADAFKGAWDQVGIWSKTLFPGLSMTIANAVNTAPVDAFAKSGLSLQKRWNQVSGWAQTSFPGLHNIVQTGLSISPVKSFAEAGKALKSTWDGIINWFAEKFGWLLGMIDKAKTAAASIGGGIGGFADGVVQKAGGLMDTVSGWLGDDPVQSRETAPRSPAMLQMGETIPQKIAAEQAQRAEMNVKSQSEVRIKIDSPVPVKVQSTRAGKGTNLSVDTGRMMLAP